MWTSASRICTRPLEGRMTQTGQYTGTPAYAAPEYIESQQVSPALDIYQIGLILGEALSGTPVVQASTPMAYLMAHCGGQQRLDERLRHTPLEPIFKRAVDVDPAARYQDASSDARLRCRRSQPVRCRTWPGALKRAQIEATPARAAAPTPPVARPALERDEAPQVKALKTGPDRRVVARCAGAVGRVRPRRLGHTVARARRDSPRGDRGHDRFI